MSDVCKDCLTREPWKGGHCRRCWAIQHGNEHPHEKRCRETWRGQARCELHKGHSDADGGAMHVAELGPPGHPMRVAWE